MTYIYIYYFQIENGPTRTTQGKQEQAEGRGIQYGLGELLTENKIFVRSKAV